MILNIKNKLKFVWFFGLLFLPLNYGNNANRI